MQEELWKEIRDLPGYYISSEGRVYSTKSNKILKPHLAGTKTQYLRVTITINNVPHRKMIHRLVLENFNPVENMKNLTVNHIDENPLNNRLENLEWMTLKDNIQYSSGQWVQQETIDGKIVHQFSSMRDAANNIGVDIHTMSDHISRGTPCKNFIWKKIDNPRKK